MSKQLPRHDRFGEYTEDEINEVKEEICMKHKCPYLKDLTEQVLQHTALMHFLQVNVGTACLLIALIIKTKT